MIGKSSGSQTEDALTLPHDRQMYIDLKGRKWKKRTTEGGAKWTLCMRNSENQEQYYMQQFALSSLLHKDNYIVLQDNSSGTYMEEYALCNLLSQGDDVLATLHDG